MGNTVNCKEVVSERETQLIGKEAEQILPKIVLAILLTQAICQALEKAARTKRKSKRKHRRRRPHKKPVEVTPGLKNWTDQELRFQTLLKSPRRSSTMRNPSLASLTTPSLLTMRKPPLTNRCVGSCLSILYLFCPQSFYSSSEKPDFDPTIPEFTSEKFYEGE